MSPCTPARMPDRFKAERFDWIHLLCLPLSAFGILMIALNNRMPQMLYHEDPIDA